ncbi:MAG: phosphatidylserine decarboxylase family protein [Candidatus Abyssubacteria bacterium]|nr:phosphatidylserine decarboxylase family protein [Candidatus Abyssubacteria bacterium]
MHIRSEALPFLLAALLVGFLILFGMQWRLQSWQTAVVCGIAVAVIFCGYLLFFFRDPDRMPPTDSSLVVSGADGTVASVTEVYEDTYLNTNCVRISIFLSLFDVHVNRAPIGGQATFLGYFHGKRFFTFQEKSSEFNQHNKILIEGNRARCLVKQIVGPVCRRVVYWLDHDKPQQVAMGERIGMMKFGSRLDMIFPKIDVRVVVEPGQRVFAGETVIAVTTNGDKGIK